MACSIGARQGPGQQSARSRPGNWAGQGTTPQANARHPAERPLTGAIPAPRTASWPPARPPAP